MIQKLIETQLQLASGIKQTNKRYLYPQISWKEKAIALTGARGTGKTTMLLQYYKDKYNDPNKCIYIVGDDIEVIANKLLNIIDTFYKLGGKCVIIDEVHKYPNWSQEIKNAYDRYPDLQIVISGSSTLEITKGKYDLSRRIVSYELHGLSFREFLNFELGQNIKPYNLNNVINEHFAISREIKSATGDRKILNLFQKYLTYGYFPYYMEGVDTYQSKLQNSLNKILYEDIPASYELKNSSIQYLKKLISLVLSEKPFLVDVSRISNTLGISREYVYQYIDYLEKAGVLIGLKRGLSGHKAIRKPEKLFIDNTNLYLSISKDKINTNNMGVIRETFAVNQLAKHGKITIPNDGDFIFDKNIIEIGGKSKLNKIASTKTNKLLFLDQIETGHQNIIPLYLLGFGY